MSHFDKIVNGVVPTLGMAMIACYLVVFRLGSKGIESGDDAIRLLSKLFSDELGYEKKLDSLEHEFKISVTKELSGEVLNVCNLSTGVYNRGYGSGKSDGKTEQAQ